MTYALRPQSICLAIILLAACSKPSAAPQLRTIAFDAAPSSADVKADQVQRAEASIASSGAGFGGASFDGVAAYADGTVCGVLKASGQNGGLGPPVRFIYHPQIPLIILRGGSEFERGSDAFLWNGRCREPRISLSVASTVGAGKTTPRCCRCGGKAGQTAFQRRRRPRLRSRPLIARR